jgi:hypothetical protein
VIELAKQYAKSKEQSLSNLIENYLKAITSEQIVVEDELSPIAKSLKGSFKAPESFDYKKQLGKQLTKKYL